MTTYADTLAGNTTGMLDRLAPLADPLVRITAGALLIPHGAQKLFGWFGGYGPEATGQYFATELGLEPGLLFALLAGGIEVFGGLLLILGLFTRTTALVVTAFLLVALSVHIPMGFFWTAGGIEYPLLWAVVTLGIFLRGGRRYSLDRVLGLRF